MGFNDKVAAAAVQAISSFSLMGLYVCFAKGLGDFIRFNAGLPSFGPRVVSDGGSALRGLPLCRLHLCGSISSTANDALLL